MKAVMIYSKWCIFIIASLLLASLETAEAI